MIRVFIKTIPTPLNWMTFGSIAALGMKVFIANRIPEAFNGAYEFGVITEGLLASVLASYIFYLIVVHIKETNDRVLIFPRVAILSRMVVGDASGLLAELSRATNTSLSLETVTQENVFEALSKIDPNGSSPLQIGFQDNNKATWRQYFLHYRLRSKESILKVMSHLVFLEAELVANIAAIDDSAYFMMLEKTANMPMKNTDATFFAEELFKYCNCCKSLQRYIDKMAHSSFNTDWRDKAAPAG